MKFLIFACCFWSLSALAFPKEGDYVRYDVTGSWTGSYDIQLTNYEPDSDTFVEVTTVTATKEGDVQASSYSYARIVDASDLLGEEDLQEQLEHCEERGNISEEIEVAAGKFQTCHGTSTVNENTLNLWMSTVPYGIIREVYQGADNYSVTLSLVEYRLGQ